MISSSTPINVLVFVNPNRRYFFITVINLPVLDTLTGKSLYRFSQCHTMQPPNYASSLISAAYVRKQKKKREVYKR